MKTVRKIEQNQSVQCSRLRVAAYCRVSTDYDAQLESLETQKSHYENYVGQQTGTAENDGRLPGRKD